MPKLAQFDEEFPLLRDQKIVSQAEGFEDLAKAAGQAAAEISKQAISLGEEKSNANLLSAHSTLQQLQQHTELELEQNSANHEKIIQSAKENAKNILANSFVNEKDRRNLDYLSNGMLNTLQFQGQKKAYELNKNRIEYQQLTEVQDQLQTVFDTSFRDPKAADILIDSIAKQIQFNVTNGIFTPATGDMLYKSLSAEIKRAQERGIALNHPDATAATVNAINSYQPSPSPVANANAPMDGHTQAIAVDRLEQRSSADIKAMIANGQTISLWDRRNLPPDQFNFYSNYQKGAMITQGKINAGTSWDELLHEQKSFSNRTLGSVDQGRRDRLNNYIENIKNGGAFEAVSNTSDGIKARQELVTQNETIERNPYLMMNDEERNKAIGIAKAKATNDYLHKIHAIMTGMNIPDQYKNAIPKNISQPVLDGFNKDADPNAAINNLALLDKTNVNNLHNQIEDPRKALVVKQTGFIMGKADPGFLISFWKSQQDGMDYEALTPKTDSDKQLTNGMITSKLLGNEKFLNIQNNFRFHPNGAKFMGAFAEEAIRYIKYQGLVNSDYKLDNIGDYIEQFSNNVGRAYNIMSSSNYNFDGNLIPFQNDYQASSYAHYALNRAYEKMSEYMNKAELEDYVTKSQPYVINDPYGNIVVVNRYNQAIPDKNGNPAFKAPYNGEAQHIAEHELQKQFEKVHDVLRSPFMVKFPPANPIPLATKFSMPREEPPTERAPEIPYHLNKNKKAEEVQENLEDVDKDMKEFKRQAERGKEEGEKRYKPLLDEAKKKGLV